MHNSSAILVAVTVALGAGNALLAQPTPPDYGYTWRTVGDPGTPGTNPADFPRLGLSVGSVPYSFRMTQTEVTNTQWLEFVDEYSTVNPNVNVNDWAFSGPLISYSQNEPGNYGWYIAGEAENAPANMSWLYAARYVNWLQNGKAMTPQAFESGVYDMSTLHDNGDLTWSGNSTRAAGSNFWIPNYDEWTKGMHFDPNRYGPEQPGYWFYENSSDSAPVGGPPGTPGAQTNAYSGTPLFMPVGSYPNQQSPWGLLDGSGGDSE